MAEMRVDQALEEGLAEIEKLDAVTWQTARREDMLPEGLYPMAFAEVSALIIHAEELHRHARP